MSEPMGIQSGQCRCGQVKLTASPPVLLTMACHCKGCQRMTSSAFSLSAMYAGSSFEVIAGEPVLGGMKAFPAHYVCSECSSWLFTRVASPVGEFVNVRATLFDEPINDPPFIETCTAEKLSWVDVKAVHSFEAFPAPDTFSGLIAQYLKAHT
jgi:hypothetical protein